SDLPGTLLGVAGVVAVVGGEATVAEDGQAVGVAEEEPAADGAAAMDGVALAEPLIEGGRPFAGLPEEWVQEGAEEVARLHPLGDHGATDARELSADAQQPCEAAHAVEPIARERAFHAPRVPPPRGMGRFQERRLPQAGAPVKTTIGRSSLFGGIGPLGIPAGSWPALRTADCVF